MPSKTISTILTRATRLLLAPLFLVIFTYTHAQDEEPDPKIEEVQSLVDFYEYMLNTVGAEKTPTRDKEVIITESFKKIFENENVQIEDDLIPDRKVITNKNVSAYLRDVDFFFNDITFDFKETSITKQTKSDASEYYLVTFENTIDGETIEGESYTQTNQRFIEVNVDRDAADLRIASVYTNKMSREKELRQWWTSLSFEWRRIFKERVPFDSLTFQVLQKMADIDSLDLSDNAFIVTIEPVSALKDLQYISVDNTQISDLKPLRYANDLQHLSANNTLIRDLSIVQYFEGLKSLNIAGTPVRDLNELSRLKMLRTLDLSGTRPTSFEPLRTLANLDELDLSGTGIVKMNFLEPLTQLRGLSLSNTEVADVSLLAKLINLKNLNISKTSVSTLSPLGSHPSLEYLNIDYTSINDLNPLLEAPALKKVSADYTTITSKQASAFMSKRPKVLVISNSEKIEKWWLSLSPQWKEEILSNVDFEPNGKEDLIRLVNLDSLDISGAQFINPAPLEVFNGVTHLDVSKNYFSDLTFLKSFDRLKSFKGDSLPISKVDVFEKLTSLEQLSLKHTGVLVVDPLKKLTNLQLLDIDGTKVSKNAVSELVDGNPNLVVIFQSAALNEWWNGLSAEWKEAFNLKQTSNFHLHQLIEIQALVISNVPIRSLDPLLEFINLREVSLNQTRITSLSPLNQLGKLTAITCANGPLQTLEGIGSLRNLKTLNIANTAVEDIRPIEHLTNIERLDCSGTSIKNFKGIDELSNLKYLNVSNTRVWKLSRIYGLTKLEKLICYNTRLSDNEIEDFKVAFGDCEVTFY